MRDKRDVMRLHIKNGIRDLNGIRESYNSFGDGGFTQRTDAIQSYAPRDRFEPIPISQEQQFNLKHFGQFNRPEQRQQTIQHPSKIKESQESKRLAEGRINNRERLQKFEEQQRIDKERELKVAPYAAMGLIGAATGTLPAMIAGEVGGRTVDYGSKKLTGKSWGENVLPGVPFIGELTNPGYIIGGLTPSVIKKSPELIRNSILDVKGYFNYSPKLNDGEQLLYHATKDKFSKFNLDNFNSNSGSTSRLDPSVFLTSKKNVAKDFLFGDDGYILSARLKNGNLEEIGGIKNMIKSKINSEDIRNSGMSGYVVRNTLDIDPAAGLRRVIRGEGNADYKSDIYSIFNPDDIEIISRKKIKNK